LPNSYAARTGRPANVGVIGVAVFAERMPIQREREEIAKDAAPPAPTPPPPAEASRSGSMAGAGAPAASTAQADAQSAPRAKAEASLARKEERLGTGHGAREFAHVDQTTFERASRYPAETVAIWYDSYANLVSQGVIARPVARTNPQPFPDGYVPDPPAR
jgi:hypothetical protein